MTTLSRYKIWYGRDQPPVETRRLRAGPIAVVLDGGDLRYMRGGEVELVRRIYVAVRDLNWNTLPAELTNLQVDDRGDAFTVTFDCRNQAREIDFVWHGMIVGTPDGTIQYTMDGVAHSDFRYAKIGICIHHPIREDAGQPFTGHSPQGSMSGVLPRTIGPQVHLDDGTDEPLFTPVDDLTIDLAGGGAVHFAFEGDLFEMEDQRNWTDASFKTASTPASLGYVHEAKSGQAICQSVTVRAEGIPSSPVDATFTPRVTIGEPTGRRLPPLGLALASHGGTLAPREIDLLRHLRLNHLRVDLHLGDMGYGDALQRAVTDCRALGCGLELAVFLSDDMAMLDQLAQDLKAASVTVCRVLVFREHDEVAAGQWVTLVRQRLQSAVQSATAFVGGTNIYFNELNRNRPEVAVMDGVVYSINPQIHAFDEASLVEALQGQAETVASARAFAQGRPIVVSPITFKPRFNAVASVPEGDMETNVLPAQVDLRQMSLFGAAWTVGSVKALAESGAASLTYYETTGWRGVMETAAGSPEGSGFPSQPGMVFPLYHVFADLAEWPSSEILACPISDPLSMAALALRDLRGTIHLLVANLTPREQTVEFTLGAGQARVRRLDEDTAPQAMFDAPRFRSTMETIDVAAGTLTLRLAPFGVIRVDSGA